MAGIGPRRVLATSVSKSKKEKEKLDFLKVLKLKIKNFYPNPRRFNAFSGVFGQPLFDVLLRLFFVLILGQIEPE